MAFDASKCERPKGRMRGAPVADRLADNLDKSGGEDACWEWQGYRNPKGYGRIVYNGKPQLAHRVAYDLANGDLDPALVVMHSCDNPPCCNPKHLSQGTHTDNKHDSMRKGRSFNPSGEAHPSTKLSDAQIASIRNSSISARLLAKKYKVSTAYIYMIKNNKYRAEAN